MTQSQIVPVKLAENEKNCKNEDTHKNNPQKWWAHINTLSVRYVYSKGSPRN